MESRHTHTHSADAWLPSCPLEDLDYPCEVNSFTDCNSSMVGGNQHATISGASLSNIDHLFFSLLPRPAFPRVAPPGKLLQLNVEQSEWRRSGSGENRYKKKQQHKEAGGKRASVFSPFTSRSNFTSLHPLLIFKVLSSAPGGDGSGRVSSPLLLQSALDVRVRG